MFSLSREVKALLFVTVLCVLAVSAAVFMPHRAMAQIINTASRADTACIAVCTTLQRQAYSTNPPHPEIQCIGSPGGAASHPCASPSSGGVASGFCEITGCKATSASGLGGIGNALGPLGQLGQALGQLLGQLMQGKSGSGSGSGSSNPLNTNGTTPGAVTCPNGYYQVSTPSSDPCAYYVAPTTPTTPGNTCDALSQALGECSANTTNNNGNSSPDSTSISPTTPGNTCDTLSQALGKCSVSTTNNNGNSSADTISVSPTSGVAPLTVTATFSSEAACADAYDLSWGDGSTDITMQYAAPASGSACEAIAQVNTPTHSYTTPGTYTVTLKSGISLQYSNTATVVVTTASNTSTNNNANNNTNNNTNTNSNTTDTTTTINPDLTTTANVTGTFQPPNTQTATLTPGLTGAIQTTGSGGTFVANNVDTNANSETSSFFGGDAIGGFVNNLISGWCQSRPWASGFIASIIPPSFFDGLCTQSGFTVGTPVSTTATTQTASTQIQTVLTQTPVQTSATPNHSTTAPSSPVPTQAPFIPPRVDIWAVPSTVPLGARTTIFWNTENVTSCSETSPDGSFNQSSLSGGAATVPLTQATVYTISCLDTQNNPATDYVTVSISG
ncbi:MAG TPA: hypothetical protein VMU13_00790 [Candidatus Paceibacterota bacterium]|nr:hypothetical protein [Candidatus Paceibacterota bacterium]